MKNKKISYADFKKIKNQPDPTNFIVNDILEDIACLKKQLKDIQDNCDHPLSERFYEYQGSSGHYNSQDNAYWVVHYCHLCRKGWDDHDQKYPGDGATEVSKWEP